HYVRDKSAWTGSVPIEIKDFEQQIDKISKVYSIVSPEDYLKPSKKPKCVLTFDDATKDQYENAFYVLNKKGIPAYFTVMSGPLTNGTIPVFHLVHTVLSHWKEKEIWSMLTEEFNLSEKKVESHYYDYEQNIYRRYIKYALNYVLHENE
ncbi:polysaccharide deacetylase, partial [Butyricicoccus sp. 1XD8-22]